MNRAPARFRASVRFLWTATGTVFLAIGIAGVILPVMPGTVFLLIASACFLRGSERMHRWLTTHPVLGRQLRILTGEEPMPLGAKVVAITSMVVAVGISIFATQILALQVGLAALAAFGAWFIIVRR